MVLHSDSLSVLEKCVYSAKNEEVQLGLEVCENGSETPLSEVSFLGKINILPPMPNSLLSVKTFLVRTFLPHPCPRIRGILRKICLTKP